MLDGLWIAHFRGPHGVGGGVVVFRRGQVFGGDSGFAYAGSYEEEGDVLKAKVTVTQFDPNVPSVLGISGNHDLLIEGKVTNDTIEGTGALATSSLVTVINGATKATTTLSDPNAKNPVAVAANPVTNKIYVANRGSNNVSVIDGAHD